MIKQSLAFNDILEKKFKILRTSIMLGNLRNREETLSEYENTAREIDRIKTSVYEELLGGKIYTTITLEEEENRLKELISFIENRIHERNEFIDDYIKITSNFLDGLDKISLENELNSYKIRYDNIKEYLSNCEEIKKYEDLLSKLKSELEEKYENKANNELINSKLEDELIEEFNRFISRNSYYSSLDYTDLDLELTKIEESLVEKKSVLDTFNSSYQALLNAGISGAEREEYASYVMDAKLNYYDDIEKKCILNIYKLVLDKQIDYDKLFSKRETIDNILNKRDEFRNNLNIKKVRDELEYFINLSKEQFSIIRAQRFNIETIDKLILDISNCENELEHFSSANDRAEILELLNEFSISNLDEEKIDLPVENEIYDNIDTVVSIKPANMVIKIKEPVNIDVKKVGEDAKLVMKKVVMVLDPKRFNIKKEKEEKKVVLEKEDEVEEITNVDNFQNEIVEEDIVEETTDVFDESSSEEIMDSLFSNDIFLDDDTNSIEEEKINEVKLNDVNNTIDNVHDIFLDDDPDEIKSNIGIEIDANNLFEDNSIENLNINVQEDSTNFNVNDDVNSVDEVVSSNIFFEQPKLNKGVDLFKSTDPFLDDNELELGIDNKNSTFDSFVPSFGSIGTVKPNNALSKIEDVVKDNEDIVLPNLGLVDNAKTDIPIVSENYIS